VPEAVRDMMPLLFELLTEEKEASVRIVLGRSFDDVCESLRRPSARPLPPPIRLARLAAP